MEGIQNALTKTIESVMSDYGGTKWSKCTLEQFAADVEDRLIEASGKLKGPQKLLCDNLLRKLKRQGSIPDWLLTLNEYYFSLTMPEDC